MVGQETCVTLQCVTASVILTMGPVMFPGSVAVKLDIKETSVIHVLRIQDVSMVTVINLTSVIVHPDGQGTCVMSRT